MKNRKGILIDIDGLRPDVFRAAMDAGTVPNLARLVSPGLEVEAVAPAPSITFCSQASLFTGAHPADHGIPGNQFFDRFGITSRGVPRHFAFDVGDTLAVDDAVLVFTNGLAAGRLQVPTIYERLAARGRTSVVAGNMYGRGASTWLTPRLTHIARLTKGGKLFGMNPRTYDQFIVDELIGYLLRYGLPDLTTLYFMGLDHDSHAYGPEPAQRAYLEHHVDPMVGQLWEAVEPLVEEPPLVAVFSDHGQIRVIPDDPHALNIGFPFDKEMGHLFSALGLDVHDYPGEDPDCDAVMALNGGLAYVYLHKQDGFWADAPVFERDVLPVARAFWEAHKTGAYASELKGALAGVLLRNVETQGWSAGYQALTPDGALAPLQEWFSSQPDGLYVDPVRRLERLASRFSGDLILISNYAEGYYFGNEMTGVHGGLHPDDSLATMVFGAPGMPAGEWEPLAEKMRSAISERCGREGGRMAATCDLMTALQAGQVM